MKTTNTATLTDDTITDDQIEQLLAEAGQAGDLDQAAICRTALLEERGACDEDRTAIRFARGACARAINAARAMAE